MAGLGHTLRAAEWNIERGLQFDMIRLAFSNSKEFSKLAQEESGPIDGERRHAIESQLERLQQTNVVILNEVDLGMRRTEYRDVAKDLARSLGINPAGQSTTQFAQNNRWRLAVIACR